MSLIEKLDEFFTTTFEPWPTETWRPNPAPTELSALVNLFEGRIDSTEAAKRFTALVNQSAELSPPMSREELASGEHGSVFDKFQCLYQILSEVASYFPEHHEKLVELLIQIPNLPDVTTEQNGQAVPYDVRGRVTWRDMPMFHEWWIDFPIMNIEAFPPGEEGYDDQLETSINLMTFMARLSAKGDANFDYIKWGAGQVAWFLEQTEWGPSVITNGHTSDEAAARFSDLNLRTINENLKIHAPWFIYNGKSLWKLNGGPCSMGGLPWSDKGFCEERWRYWKEQWQWLQCREETSPDDKRLISDVLAAMDAAEG